MSVNPCSRLCRLIHLKRINKCLCSLVKRFALHVCPPKFGCDAAVIAHEFDLDADAAQFGDNPEFVGVAVGNIRTESVRYQGNHFPMRDRDTLPACHYRLVINYLDLNNPGVTQTVGKGKRRGHVCCKVRHDKADFGTMPD